MTTMETRIIEMSADVAEDGTTTLHVEDEYGVTMDLDVIASDRGRSIADHDGDDRRHALLVTVDRDGSAGYAEAKEGDTFGVTCQDEYRVVRTDSAGSLCWKEAQRG